MPMQLKIVSDHHELLGEDFEKRFSVKGGTIGRSLENDWILPDPDRYISGRHATVDYQSGAYYLADISSNGVYINDETEPLGKGNPRRLFDGDRLRMGDFEFIVGLDEGEDLSMPPQEPITAVPDHIEQLVPEELVRTGLQLVTEEEITGDDEFQSTLFGKAEDKKPAKKTESTAKPGAPAKIPPQTEPNETDDLLDAFLGGLGIDRSELHPSTDAVEVMTNAGRVLNEFVSGITELLIARANLKNRFKLDKTTVLPSRNNPLKMSQTTKDSVKQLLVGKEGEYVGPLDSVREVCRDLRIHHDAMLEGMSQAVHDLTDRFDPEDLKENFDRTLDRKPLFTAFNKLKYWDLYCYLYPIITQHGTGHLPHLFAEEFARAYEKQIVEFKRVDVGGGTQSFKRVVLEEVEPQSEEIKDQIDGSATG